ncbi:hypothetical protein SUSAZ_01765 [Sulfolobus acidocaldarius SUSAZ]|nr:hypothetical protein SUSAZ_01765 [Sulfolobus acidocaldarius SUSAZ]
MSIENEAKKLAATYARWLRNPQDALFGKEKEGVVIKIYQRLKQAKTKSEILEILQLNQYEMEKTTMNDMNRMITELISKLNSYDEDIAVKFTIEVFRYLQIALYTKLDSMKRGLWY